MQSLTESATNDKNKNILLGNCLNKLKSQHNSTKYCKTIPVLLVPITFMELKAKQEKENFVMPKMLHDSGPSSLLVSKLGVQHLKKVDSTGSLFDTVAGEFEKTKNVKS